VQNVSVGVVGYEDKTRRRGGNDVRDETGLLTGGSESADGGGFTDVLVVTTTVRVCDEEGKSERERHGSDQRECTRGTRGRERERARARERERERSGRGREKRERK
jgi:hypothetical protein